MNPAQETYSVAGVTVTRPTGFPSQIAFSYSIPPGVAVYGGSITVDYFLGPGSGYTSAAGASFTGEQVQRGGTFVLDRNTVGPGGLGKNRWDSIFDSDGDTWIITITVASQSTPTGGGWVHSAGAGTIRRGEINLDTCRPIPESLHVYLNGLEQYAPEDWTLMPPDANHRRYWIRGNAPMDAKPDDLFEARYVCLEAYQDTAGML